jgi:biopolymer transport protein ExbB
MATTLRTLTTKTLVMSTILLNGGLLFAQEEAAEAAAGAAEKTVQRGPGFWDIVYGDSLVNLLIWLMIAATSFATVWLIIDAIITVKREKLLPEDVVDGVRDALSEGDLGVALETCEANPGPLSTILMAGFSNIHEGYEVIQESVASSAEMESEKVMQRVNYLNLCGQIAPMLGLLGTVVGMVAAFGGLATATGAAKGQILAQSISTALWTTCVGLLISVPALLAFTLIRNYATRLILETEATVLDLIKVLRNAEVEDAVE